MAKKKETDQWMEINLDEALVKRGKKKLISMDTCRHCTKLPGLNKVNESDLTLITQRNEFNIN